MKRAFTILEVLRVIGILMFLAGLMVPVFTMAKQRAHREVSASNLRQIWAQTVLYQQDYDGEGIYGTSYQMGLPPRMKVSQLISALDQLRPPKAPHPLSGEMGQIYHALYADPEMDGMQITWTNYAQRARERSVLYIDPFDNDPTLSLTVGNHITRRFLAVELGGRLLRLQGKGFWLSRNWWLIHQGIEGNSD